MSLSLNLKVCRMCQSPDSKNDFKFLFKDEELVEMFEELTGLKIENCQNKNNALICDKCLRHLEDAFRMRQRIARAEKYYFQPKREAAKSNSNVKSDKS